MPEFSSRPLLWQCFRMACWILVPGLTSTSAQPPALPAIRKTYEMEIARTVQPLREGYVKALLTLERQIASRGDYAGARQVRDKRLEMERLITRNAAEGGSHARARPRLPDAAPNAINPGPAMDHGGGLLKNPDGTWTRWETAGAYLRWNLPADLPPGGYRLDLFYTCSAAGTLPVTVREEFHSLSRELKISPSGQGQEGIGRVELGVLRLRRGAGLLELKLTQSAALPDFCLVAVHLVPQEEEP